VGNMWTVVSVVQCVRHTSHKTSRDQREYCGGVYVKQESSQRVHIQEFRLLVLLLALLDVLG
jgi:hypothetical protein